MFSKHKLKFKIINLFLIIIFINKKKKYEWIFIYIIILIYRKIIKFNLIKFLKIYLKINESQYFIIKGNRIK